MLPADERIHGALVLITSQFLRSERKEMLEFEEYKVKLNNLKPDLDESFV